MSTDCLAVILAAGDGKRMKSDLPKVLHPIAGLPMVAHVIRSAKLAGISHTAVVVGEKSELVGECARRANEMSTIHIQNERLGTAHAVLAARELMSSNFNEVLILYGDVPLITPNTINRARKSVAQGSDLSVLGFETCKPFGYGRMVMQGGKLTSIIEHKNASEKEKKITYCNSGIMIFKFPYILDILEEIKKNNSQKEYYLTDAVEVGINMGLRVHALDVDEEEILGVNDRVQLAHAEQRWQFRRRRELLMSGVSMSAPDTVVLSHDTVVYPDVTIEPNVIFGENVLVMSGAKIRAFSYLEGARVGSNAVIGPYARLRSDTRIDEGVRVGCFVETKTTYVGPYAKINHLSYVGDSEIGSRTNVGAGTITCNYDGYSKYKTVIGEDVFIGSNTSLVAPLKVGSRSNTGAGSIIYKDVSEDTLAIERNDQINKEGYAKFLRNRNKAKKFRS
ncbi:bifunctional UDP-N-acetylglucosamine diphosphorylase/glucosamine-1-phosphate N-acetyltransferase GlmU [Candidatus Endowatersipora endosymbiont of Watersipora subatra]|uniref:bifunctional UDP-N-acetylglucosamine diphosphorylase/glucosamine-1-phosphate N-acetyltransferase GlmU n=1 Tax=Candidatus Endowatersipora endosymbiont of Watersipora subatra TaxID=3077946 RepID=UPI00312C7834